MGMARDRRSAFGVHEQFVLVVPLLVCWAIAAVVLLLVGSRDQEQQTGLLLAPITVGRLPWYTGLVGSLGVLAWAVGATAAGAGALVARLGDRPGASRFLAHVGIYTFVLAINDMFELHAQLLPEALGVSKPVVLMVLLGALPVLMLANHNEVRRTRTLVLSASVAALVGALVIDLVGPASQRALLLEESAQFLGVVAWAVWLVTTSFDVIVSVVAPQDRSVRRRSAEPIEHRLSLIGDEEQDRGTRVGSAVLHR